MKKFLIRMLMLLPIPITIIWINWSVDSAHFFNKSNNEDILKSYEFNISQALHRQSNVTNVGNYDERLVQKYYIEQLRNKNDVIILGSSRSMVIDHTIFPGQSFFNNSVSGATLEDFMAIYDVYREKGMIPSTVVLEMPSWILNKNNYQMRWKSLEKNYEHLNSLVSGATFNLNYKIADWFSPKFIEFISPSYFQESWKQWRVSKKYDVQGLAADSDHQKITITHQSLNDAQTIMFDGSRITDKETRLKTVEEVRREAITFANMRESYGLDSFFELDKKLKDQLTGFIRCMKNDHVSVVLFLSPYHPAVYKTYTRLTQYKIIQAEEEYLINLGKKYGIRVIGSYDPNKVGAKEEDFIDGMHFKKSVIEKIFLNQER